MPIRAFMKNLLEWLNFISTYKWGGLLSLDLVLHSIVAFFVFIIILNKLRDRNLALLYITYLGVLKEIFDLHSLGQNFYQAGVDFISNYSLIALYLAFKLWSRSKHW